MMSGHTNHSQKHQTRVGLSWTRQGALLYTFEGVCFQSPDSFFSHISREVATLRRLELFQPLVIQLFISWQEILLLSKTGLDYILELYLKAAIMSLLNTRKCWELLEPPIIP